MSNILRIVQGNTFGTAIEINAVDAEGHAIQDFSLDGSTDIRVWYVFAGKEVDVEAWSIDDGKVVILWDGRSEAMRLGTYDIFIEGMFEETAWRNAMKSQFTLVKYNYEAYIPDDVIVLNGIYQLTAQMSLITRVSGGGGTPSQTIPLMDGEASVGEETAYARGDHRHPSDTSKQNVITDLDAIRAGSQAGATAYQKPSGGIPKTDLASGVQTSLGKADTAVQPSALEGYQPLIDNSHKLSADLVDDASTTNKFCTASEKTTWNNKSDFSGSYNDLTNKPTIPAAQVNSDWNANSGVAQILNKPTIPAAQVNADWDAVSGVAQILNKPTIPSVVDALNSESTTSALSANQGKVLNDGKQDKIDAQHKLSADLVDDTSTTNKFVTSSEKTTWNNKSDFSGSYNDLTNKPTIPAAGIPAGGNAGQVLTKTDGSTDYAVAWRDTNNIFTSAYCTTSAATAAKAASCTLWTATANSYLHVLITKANSNQGALTLNVNSTGAAPIYINGTVSSSTNYTLPAGSYIVFYDGTNYYFRTDGKLTASITGTAAGTPVVSHGTSDTTFALTPNVWHSWGTISALTLTLATPADNTIVNLYMFEFTSGATATTLSMPQTITWENGVNPTIEANTRYEITIQNGGAKFSSFPTA